MKQNDWMYPYDQPIRDLIKQERSKLLKSLVEEVKKIVVGEIGEMPTDFNVGYKTALQDVIKVIKEKV
jgi:hypothetical protein